MLAHAYPIVSDAALAAWTPFLAVVIVPILPIGVPSNASSARLGIIISIAETVVGAVAIHHALKLGGISLLGYVFLEKLDVTVPSVARSRGVGFVRKGPCFVLVKGHDTHWLDVYVIAATLLPPRLTAVQHGGKSNPLQQDFLKDIGKRNHSS